MTKASEHPPASAPRIVDETAMMMSFISEVVDAFPRRQATSESERLAHEKLRGIFEGLGVDVRLEPFRFNANIHANLGLHAGLGSLGSLLSQASPATSFVLHTLVGASYFMDMTFRAEWLRRLLPYGWSQNLVAVLPAKGEPAQRVVFVGHIDAAPTAFIFDPKLLPKIAKSHNGPLDRVLGQPLRLFVGCEFALAGLDLLGLALGRHRRWLRPATLALSIPGLLALTVATDALLRDEIVPGANDNLTGCAALPVLASRLGADKPDDVELVFVATGAEEAGLGGSRALLDAVKDRWSQSNTVVLAIDGLSNGELRWFEEGEMIRWRPAPWLEAAMREATASDPRFATFGPFEVGVGGTDAGPFRAAGYDAVGIGGIDPRVGAPGHYHWRSDTPENLNVEELVTSVDLIEALTRIILRHRRG